MIKKILIYKDEGVSDSSVSSIISELMLRKIDLKYHIIVVDRSYFQKPDWKKSTQLIIFPGGRDSPYHAALQGEGNSNIRDYVEKGGNFLGICAGAYYGCARIEFEKNNPLEIIADRELKFFPGTAAGPAYGLGKFQYNTEKGAKIAQINLSCENSAYKAEAYFNGGCIFIDTDKYPGISITGTYADIKGEPAAIIECLVGKGKVILSGVHPEFSAYHDISKANIQGSLLHELKHIEESRKTLFTIILNKLL